MFATTDSTGINPVSLLVHALYNAAEMLTGIVGLTPVQVLIGVGAIFLVFVIVGIVRAYTGKTSFSLEDDKGSTQE